MKKACVLLGLLLILFMAGEYATAEGVNALWKCTVNDGEAIVTKYADYAYEVVAPGNETYTSVDGVLYDAQLKTLAAYPGARKGDYSIPEGVSNIGVTAFYECGEPA